MTRRTHGYSVKPRLSRADGRTVVSYTVSVPDPLRPGKRLYNRAHGKAQADAVGRDMAQKADRVRAGLVTPEEHRAAQAGKLDIAKHIEAWKQATLQRGRTAKYADIIARRLIALGEGAGVTRLDSLSQEAAARALAGVAEDTSAQTGNHYRAALRTFLRWCVATGRLRPQPFTIPRLSAPGEVFKRQPITPDQFAALLFAAAVVRRDKGCTMDGRRRAKLYFVMAHTGFRLSEAGSLTPESFDLADPENAYVTVEAAFSKHRREDRQPIRPDVARELALWLVGQPKGARVFPLPRHFERVFVRDCRAAGVVAADGFRLGTHSLRRFYITNVVRAGGLAVGQELARHSTPMLTRKYTDLTRRDLREGLGGLPAAGKKPSNNRKTG